jgi:hypothetical protein
MQSAIFRAKSEVWFVIYRVSDSSPPALPNLFVVDFEFKPGHLGISVLVLARDRMSALRRAWKLFPEYRWRATGGSVHEADYAEVDWETGRCVVKTRPVRLRIRPPKLSDTNVGTEDKHE